MPVEWQTWLVVPIFKKGGPESVFKLQGDFPVASYWEEVRGRPRIRLRDYISLLARERLRIPQEELESLTGKRDVTPGELGLLRVSLLNLLPLRPG